MSFIRPFFVPPIHSSPMALSEARTKRLPEVSHQPALTDSRHLCPAVSHDAKWPMPSVAAHSQYIARIRAQADSIRSVAGRVVEGVHRLICDPVIPIPQPVLVGAGHMITFPIQKRDELFGGPMLMASKRLRSPATGRNSQVTPASKEAPTDLVPAKKGLFDLVTGSKMVQWLKKLVWDPVDIGGDCFRWYAEQLKKTPEGLFDGDLPKGFFMHVETNPTTRRLLALVNQHAIRPKGEPDPTRPSVLELGSGDGALARIIENQTGLWVLRLDILLADNDACRVKNGDMTHLPFEDNQFGLVLSSFAFEYAGPDALREAFRVLKPGAKFVALVHHQNSGIADLRNWTTRLMRKASFAALNFRLSRKVLPKFVVRQTEFLLRMTNDLQERAFASQEQLRRQLVAAGFAHPEIEVAMSPPLFSQKGTPMDVGWIVVAKKPIAKGRHR